MHVSQAGPIVTLVLEQSFLPKGQLTKGEISLRTAILAKHSLALTSLGRYLALLA